MAAREEVPLLVAAEAALSNSEHPVKCQAVGCRGPPGALLRCCNMGCDKVVHKDCYWAIVKKYKVEALADPATDSSLAVCSKTCYNKVEKAFIHQPIQITLCLFYLIGC